MWSFISGIFTMGAGVVNGWQKRKTAALESDLRVNEAVTDAKIKRLATGQSADIAWEQTALNTAGWKDEWLLIIFSIPLIMVFIPGLVSYVEAGFVALQNTPVWYQSAIGVMVAASFGYRKIADLMSLKKGD